MLKRSRTGEDHSVSPPPSKKKIESSTTGKVVANFFKKTSEKEPEKLKWRVLQDSLLVGRYDGQVKNSHGEPAAKRRKIAAFDFDSTLIKTSSGNAFGKSAEDWAWWHSSVKRKLHQLYDEGYQVVIVSNQGGISINPTSRSSNSKPAEDKSRLTQFKTKVNYVLHQLEIPISIYAATGKDGFRKPRTGMWTQLMEDYGLHGNDEPDLKASFFVGDAAGREEVAGKFKADHSCSDRNFAANVGIKFHTPEEFFLDEAPRPFRRSFDPDVLLSSSHDTSKTPIIEKKHELELILLCGSPGAGKSTFYARYLQPLGYERVNQDILKSRDKCLKVAAEYLSSKHSVVVDNTNADADTRWHWIELARQHSIPIRAVHLTTPKAVCVHNDTVRAAYDSKSKTYQASTSWIKSRTAEEIADDLSASFNPEHRSILPSMAFSSFQSRFLEPSIEEGFEDVIKVPFVFDGSESARAVWGRYWV